MVKRTARKFKAAVVVRTSQGEKLEHSVDFRGGTALFAIADNATKRIILSQDDPGPIWQRVWPAPGDPPPVSTGHGFGCSFLEAAKYTWTVTHVKASGAREVVVDVDYEATAATDHFFEGITVLVP